MESLLADLILVTHFLFVAFVVGGLALVCVGGALGWRWVRNFWFRIAHLAAIVFVTGEALVGVMCPLTIWEDALRGARTEQSFIARWIQRILFHDFPQGAFTIAYIAFALIVAMTLWIVRLEPRKK